jgi:alpha-mannosidase
MGDRSILSVEPAELVVTSVKQAEDRESVILRFYNTVERAVEGSVRLPGAVRHRLVNLNEEPLGEWQAGESLRLPVTAKRIVTIEFELAER